MKKLLIALALTLGFNAQSQSTEYYVNGNAGGAVIIGYTVPYFTIGAGIESPINDNYFIDAQINAPIIFLIQPSLGVGRYSGDNVKLSMGVRTFPQFYEDSEFIIGEYFQYEYKNWNLNIESFGLAWITATVGYRYYF